MHWIVPFASAMSEGAHEAQRRIDWKPLAAYDAGRRTGRDEWSLTPPHERALAEAIGLEGADGSLPWAAREAGRAGIDVGDRPFARLPPCHWHVGRDQVLMTDPATLELDEAESRALFDALPSLFADDGIEVHHAATLCWDATHADFDDLACGSIDRAIGRAVDAWLPSGPGARRIRRLQSEVQMLWHTHPVNAAREARGLRPVNSFWIDGCGRAQPERAAEVRIDTRLRPPALAGDWAAWLLQWRALLDTIDASVHTLTLCGERFAQTCERRERAWWQQLGRRTAAPDAARLIEL